MTRDGQAPSTVRYLRLIRPLIPKQAFSASPRKLVIVAIHMIAIGTGFVVIRVTSQLAIWTACSLVIGHSLACVAFLAHELSHNTLLRGSRFRYVLEVLLWGINLIPPTVWRSVHNNTHHHNTNTLNDPDRQFTLTEASTLTTLYTLVFYPNRCSLPWNGFVGLHFIPYILRNTIAVFYPNSTKSVLVTAKPLYSVRQRLMVAFELGCIAAFQVCLFIGLGNNGPRYLMSGPIAICFASCVVMAYVFTNHFLNDLSAENDPVANSTSVIVPLMWNRLHSNFSYHTEHHLFPGMNSDYYPMVSQLLQEHCGSQYHRITLRAAWVRLWSNEAFVSYTYKRET